MPRSQTPSLDAGIRIRRARARQSSTRTRAPILIVSAFAPELAPLRRLLDRRVLPRTGVILAQVGIGLVEAGIGTRALLGQAPLCKTPPRLVLFVGTAGVHPDGAPRLPIGVAAVPARATLYCPAEQTGEAYLPTRMVRTADCARAVVADLRALGGYMVDTVACPLGISRRITHTSARRPLLENLEVFAVARAALHAHIPFATVLGVSNRIGKRAHAEWRAHGAAAARSACALVAAFMESECLAA